MQTPCTFTSLATCLINALPCEAALTACALQELHGCRRAAQRPRSAAAAARRSLWQRAAPAAAAGGPQLFASRDIACCRHGARRHRYSYVGTEHSRWQLHPNPSRLVVRRDDKVGVGRAVVVNVIDAGDLRRLVHAQALRGVQRPEQRQAACARRVAGAVSSMKLLRVPHAGQRTHAGTTPDVAGFAVA